MTDASLPVVVGRQHAWLESMRLDGGYGGPVSHWWRHALRYAGPGLDWRYEGLINGYLNLYATTDTERWLNHAIDAGRDLVAGQVMSGNYRASAFERNPELGGTPHEATASSALARLATVCRDEDRDWRPFAETARSNLQWHIDALWRDSANTFSDTVGMASYVPNKIASTIEAFLAFGVLTGQDFDSLVEKAAETILDLQVESGPQRGAIHQLWIDDDARMGDGKFFPLYIARCIPPLLRVADATGQQRFEDAAMRAGRFLKRVERPDGSFPQVIYETGDRNVAPRWVAGVGDILRAYDALSARGFDFGTATVEAWLLAGQDASGGFRTAEGFGRVIGRDERTLPDVVPVVGWNDKAFRWLTSRVDTVEDISAGRTEVAVSFGGVDGSFVESTEELAFLPQVDTMAAYRWNKASRWTELADHFR